jgi:hypothetical protein
MILSFFVSGNQVTTDNDIKGQKPTFKKSVIIAPILETNDSVHGAAVFGANNHDSQLFDPFFD